MPPYKRGMKSATAWRYGRDVEAIPVPKPIDLVAEGAPDAPALILRDTMLSYAELEAAVARLAGWLAALELSEGARIATWLPKTREACLMPLAAPRAGMVHVPVNPLLKRAQVAHILADSGAALLITQAARATTFEPGDVPEGMMIQTEAGEGDALPPSSADPDTLAAILYTSGSTGRPKGVMLSHANLWLGARSVSQYLEIKPEDRVLGVLPLSFDYGQNQLFSTWATGAAVAPLDYLTARDVVKAVDRVGATTLAGVPPLWTQLLDADWPVETAAKLRRLTNSGGALTQKMVRNLRARFPAADLYPMYGLTEAFRSTYLAPPLVDTHPDSIGRAIPYAEVLVVRSDGTKAQAGEPGELVHAGPLVAQGYWQDADRTATRFRPAPAFSAFGGMAVWSGDTVVADEAGLLRFVGRDDEMIKSAGNRISPTEVEEAVLAGDEARAAVAIGVPDARLGQAIVVTLAGNAAQEEALRARLLRTLPNFMQPARYRWLAELPRNANGKLDRAAIRAAVLAEEVA
jgi:acyl-CoA ligase (AMP-forming) (exosortase A-associated)